MNDEENPEDDWMICAVCGYPLEHAVPGSNVFGGGEWGHIRPEMQDHPPVPTESRQVQFNSRCDFCDAEKAPNIVLCDSFDVPGTLSRSVGHWASCEHCTTLVRRRRWVELVNYVKATGGAEAQKAPRSLLRAMYEPIETRMYGVITVDEWKERNGYKAPPD